MTKDFLLGMLAMSPILMLMTAGIAWLFMHKRLTAKWMSDLDIHEPADIQNLMARHQQKSAKLQQTMGDLRQAQTALEEKTKELAHLQNENETLEHDITRKHAASCRFEKKIQKQQKRIDRLERALADFADSRIHRDTFDEIIA